jgi:ABC-2 type transport system ATP-binding protein
MSAPARIGELLTDLQLEPVACRRFGELPTGNKQRVITARAMLPAPPVLLLDEPTLWLDPLAAAEMRATIQRLTMGDPAISVLLTSHNLGEVEELCGRVAVISRRRIRAVGPPQSFGAPSRPADRVRLVAAGVESSHVGGEAWLAGMTDAGASANGGAVETNFTREPGMTRSSARCANFTAQGAA